MNKALCLVLRDKLVGLPFVDVLAAMAQTLTRDDVNQDTQLGYTKREPVSTDCLGIECEGREVSLIPNSNRKSIIYFEDYGISTTDVWHGHTGYNSSIRLVCWLNRLNLVGNKYQDVAGRMMAAIIARLCTGNPQNVGMFIRLTVQVARIPPQDPALFSRYTYFESDRQYLRPPFEFFAIDFNCKFYVPANCLQDIDWNVQGCN
jgi:hypothetical protein